MMTGRGSMWTGYSGPRGHQISVKEALDALGLPVRQFSVSDEDAAGLPAEFTDLDNWKEW